MDAIEFGRLDVLFVERRGLMKRLVQGILGNLGVGRVTVAETVEEAWSLFKESSHSLIITDTTEHLDGGALVKMVRAESSSRRRLTPIIVTTTLPDAGESFMMQDADVTEYLPKPFTSEHLREGIVSVIAKARAHGRTDDALLSTVTAFPSRSRGLASRNPAHGERRMSCAPFQFQDRRGDRADRRAFRIDPIYSLIGLWGG